MTNEELAKSILMELDGGYISYGNFHGNNEQGLNLIKGALEKQIPKKPIWHVLSKYKNGNVKEGVWKCPTCLRIEYVKRRDALDTYCGFCGQKIDYEGVEE